MLTPKGILKVARLLEQTGGRDGVIADDYQDVLRGRTSRGRNYGNNPVQLRVVVVNRRTGKVVPYNPLSKKYRRGH